MKAGREGAPRMPVLEDTDHVARRHDLAGAHRRGDRLVGRAQAAGVVDADHPLAREETGEDDHAGAGGEDRFPGGAGEVDPAVSGQPRLRRWRERAGDPQRTVHRGPPPGGHHERCWWQRRRLDRAGRQHREKHHSGQKDASDHGNTIARPSRATKGRSSICG